MDICGTHMIRTEHPYNKAWKARRCREYEDKQHPQRHDIEYRIESDKQQTKGWRKHKVRRQRDPILRAIPKQEMAKGVNETRPQMIETNMVKVETPQNTAKLQTDVKRPRYKTRYKKKMPKDYTVGYKTNALNHSKV